MGVFLAPALLYFRGVKRIHLMIGILVLALAACSRGSLQDGENGADDDFGDFRGVTCAEYAAAGLYASVAVPAGWSADSLRQELVVKYTDETGREQTMSLEVSDDGSSLEWAGAYEYAGPFTVTVRLRSVTNSISNVVSQKDECHVKGVRVNVSFSPPARIDLSQSGLQ